MDILTLLHNPVVVWLVMALPSRSTTPFARGASARAC